MLRQTLILNMFNVLVLLWLLLLHLQTQSAVANHLPTSQRLPVDKPTSVFGSELRVLQARPLNCVSLLHSLLFLLLGEGFDVASHLVQH